MVQIILMSTTWLFIAILTEVLVLPCYQTRHFRRLAPTIFCALSYVVCFMPRASNEINDTVYRLRNLVWYGHSINYCDKVFITTCIPAYLKKQVLH